MRTASPGILAAESSPRQAAIPQGRLAPRLVMGGQVRRGKLGFWLRLAVLVIKPTMFIFVKRDWRGMQNIPKSGGLIVVANHISYADPFPLANFVYDAGRLPRFLAKAQLFRTRFVKWVVKGAGQIPVERYTAD